MRVHRNLHNARRGGPQWVSTVRGKVDQYLDRVVLAHVTTRIQPAGARRCQESGVRSVCAFFDGLACQEWELPSDAPIGWHRVHYDPRIDEAFLASDPGGDFPWNRADAVILEADGRCYVLNPDWAE